MLLTTDLTNISNAWRKFIHIPKIKELEHEIERREAHIKANLQQISQLSLELQKWDSYRDLLTATGDALENIVQQTLLDVGIKTNKTEKGFPAYLISEEVAIEVTGIKGSLRVNSLKVNQIARLKESYSEDQKIILITNTHMDLAPEERKDKINFSPEVKNYFQALSVCCVTTITLFQLWMDVINKNRDINEVKSILLTTNGEVILND